MKSNFKTSPQIRALARIFFAAVVVFALSATSAFAEVVNAAYQTGAEVPVRANGFTATDKSVNLTLNFAPSRGAQLMVVQNTGSRFISGKFSNLKQGQLVALNYRGATYYFVANYYGGHGKDLVLMWTSGQDLSASTLAKLDSQLVLALKRSRGEAPFDRPTSLRPEDYEIGGRVLVDMKASVSKELRDQIALLGGQAINGWATATTLRAWVPFAQLETLASRADVSSMSAARPSVTHRITR